MVYRVLKFGRPMYLRDLFSYYCIDSDMTLRYSVEYQRLTEPRYNFEIGRNAFINSAPRLFNKLPEHVKMVDKLEDFQKKLKSHLFAICYDLNDMTMKTEVKCIRAAATSVNCRRSAAKEKLPLQVTSHNVITNIITFTMVEPARILPPFSLQVVKGE